MRGGVEVHRADAPFTADGKVYDAGSWVVRLDQPFRPFAKDLLEAQRYPDIRTSPGGPPVPPYDIAGWTLAYQMGVSATAIEKPFDAPLTRLEAYPTVTGRIRTGPDSVQDAGTRARTRSRRRASTSWIPQRTRSSRPSTSCWRPACRCRAPRRAPAKSAPGMDPRRIRRVRANAGAGRVLTTTIRQHGVTADLRRAAEDGRVAARFARRASALYRSWIANIDEGWTRWVLEQFGFQYTTVTNADIQAGHLADRFDVVIVPSQSPRAILEGHRPDAARPRAGPWSPVPAEYQGGIGDAGVTALKDFVQPGGRSSHSIQASDLGHRSLRRRFHARPRCRAGAR